MEEKESIVKKILDIKDDKARIAAKIEYINEHPLDDIPGRIKPDTATNDYFFISYCHADYQIIYKDLFLLGEQGLSFWYDKDMVVGDSWLDTANKYMVPRACLGVLFYVSENSLKSNPVLEELNFAKKTQKPFICISLPFNSDYLHHGESVKGKTYLPFDMIDILLENKIIDNDKAESLRGYFPKPVTYLKYNQDIFDRFKTIKDKLKKQPILRYDKEGVIISISDTNITKVVPEDFDPHHRFITIGKCAFANCAFLESVTLPKANRLFVHESPRLYRLDDYAFFSDKMLKTFDGGGGLVNSIPNHAFENCFVLETIGNDEIKFVGERAFANCYQLKSINLDNRPIIGKEAFLNCKNLISVGPKLSINNTESANANVYHPGQAFTNLKQEEIDQEKETTIEEGAFNGCKNLVEFCFPYNAISLKRDTFKDCHSLRKIVLFENVKNIKSSAFLNCDNLESIILVNNPNFIMKEGALYENKYKRLIKVLPNIKDKFLLPKETKIIDKYAFSHFKNKPFISVDISNESFFIYKGGLVDKEKKHLFFLNVTKNDLSVLSEIKYIEAFALDNFADNEMITIYDNIHEIGDYVFYSFKNLKTIELFANSVKLNPYSFDYRRDLDTLIVKTNQFNFSDFSRFNHIHRIELHNDVTLMGDWYDMPEVDELVVLSKRVNIEDRNLLVNKVIIGKYFLNNESNSRVLKMSDNVEIDPDNPNY